MVPNSAHASDPKKEITPANIHTPRIAAADCICRATRLGTTKMPAPITMPITIDTASRKPSFRGRPATATGISVCCFTVRTHYTPSLLGCPRIARVAAIQRSRELADLTLAIVQINGWNRLSIATRTLALSEVVPEYVSHFLPQPALLSQQVEKL